MAQSISRQCARVAAIVLLGACGEIAAPAPGGDAPSVSADLQDMPAGTLKQQAAAPRLTTYDTTFTVYQGHANIVKVCYEDNEGPCLSDDDTLGTSQVDESAWFLKILYHRSTQFIDPAGVPLASGDSLKITLSIDSTAFLASFSPHGLEFEVPLPQHQPKLSFHYVVADLTGKDPNDLGIWYQPVEGEQWVAQASEIDVANEAVSMKLYHFSNYALAF